ncbi:hypothetical protein D3C85_625950 [compost metagenome]
MSNFWYLVSRTPSATFSKSQKSAMLTFSLGLFMLFSNAAAARGNARQCAARFRP